MADQVTAGPISSANGVREAVCIHTRKIFSACRDKDCIEDLAFYPTVSAQSVIAEAQSIRGGRVELLCVNVDVQNAHFNRGFYTVDMRFYYRVILQAMTGGMRPTEIDGLAVFDKRVVLFGGESGAKIFTSDDVVDPTRCGCGNMSRPTAIVESVDPLLLCAKLIDRNCCDCMLIAGVPANIACAFDEPLVFDGNCDKRVCISIGQFSIVRLERETQLLIPVFDYCIPTGSCMAAAGDCSTGDPCEMFEDVEFPLDAFFPTGNPTMGDMDSGCGCCCR